MDLYCGMVFQNNWVSCGWWGSIVESFFSEPFLSGGKKWSKKNHDYIIYPFFMCTPVPPSPSSSSSSNNNNNTKKEAPTLVFPFLKENPFLSIDMFES